TGVPKPNYVCETQPVKQGKLVMGFRTGMRNADDNDAAMRVAVDIFGGGTYSKLFSVVREKMSLCYYCSAMLVKYKGIVMIQSGIENENEEKAKKEILNQLSEVANGNFSNDDFSASIKSLCDSCIAYNDTPEELCAWYAVQIFKENPLTPESRAEKIRSVDRADVIRCAKSIMLDTVYMLKGSGEGENDEN
ncbi:MAG: insulinase family protein, partial [Clostridia bacterium]|nr:insulinase family protein [Clostridia bacterium]